MASSLSPDAYDRHRSPNHRSNRQFSSPQAPVKPEQYGSLSPHDHWVGGGFQQGHSAQFGPPLGQAPYPVDDAQWLGYDNNATSVGLTDNYPFSGFSNATTSGPDDFGLFASDYAPIPDSADAAAQQFLNEANNLNNWETVQNVENYDNQLYNTGNQGGGHIGAGLNSGAWQEPNYDDMLNAQAATEQYQYDLYSAHPAYQEQTLAQQSSVTSFNPRNAPVPEVSKEEILGFFQKNYARHLGNLPPAKTHTPDSHGNIMCRFCQPSKPVSYVHYQQHKLEVHGVNFNTGYRYHPPMDVRYMKNIGYEGYCPSCDNWIPLDLKRQDYNWSHHAISCQDNFSVLRYISSSSADEGAAIEDIDRAARKLARKQQHLTERYLAGTDKAGSVWGSSSSNSNSNSNSNSGSSIYSGTSAGSSNSARSASSITSYRGLEGSLTARRKKALRHQKRRGAKNSDPNARVYQCTFCISDFVSFGDWRRHEENVHLVLSKWVCAPEGRFKPGTSECVYCDVVHTDPDSLHRCNDKYCHDKDPADRVFSRKDHLKQHLKRVHGVQWKPAYEAWSIKTQGPTRSRCGFCGATFDSWHARMHHVGYEFKSGHRMAYWQGDWGLDGVWMSEEKLGNAIIPKEREDHQPRTLKSNGQPESKRHSKNPVYIKQKAAHAKAPADAPRKGLQRKPAFDSLRRGSASSTIPENSAVGAIPQMQDLYGGGGYDFQPEQQQFLPVEPTWPQANQFQSPPMAQGPWGADFQSEFNPGMYHQQDDLNRIAQTQQYQNIGLLPGPLYGDVSLTVGIAPAPLQTVTTPPHLLSPPDSANNSAEVTPITQTAATHACIFCGKRYTRQDNLRRHAKTCTQAWSARGGWVSGEG